MKIKYRIQFQHLQRFELTYEVAVRGVEPEKSYVNLLKQISTLRKSHPSDKVTMSNYDFDDDYAGIQFTMHKIYKNLNVIERKYTAKMAAQTLAMINHIYFRVGRWLNSQNNFQDKSIRKKMRQKVRRVMTRFSTISDSQPADGEPSVKEETMDVSDEDSIDRAISRVVDEEDNQNVKTELITTKASDDDTAINKQPILETEGQNALSIVSDSQAVKEEPIASDNETMEGPLSVIVEEAGKSMPEN